MSYENVYVIVYVIGHDRLTGLKKLYESPKYRFHNLDRGSWDGIALIRPGREKTSSDTSSKSEMPMVNNMT